MHKSLIAKSQREQKLINDYLGKEKITFTGLVRRESSSVDGRQQEKMESQDSSQANPNVPETPL